MAVPQELVDATLQALRPFLDKLSENVLHLSSPQFQSFCTIISAIQRETGFLRDIFSESEISGNFSSNKQKTNFIQKLKDYIQFLIGHEIDVTPDQVCIGQKPEKTLNFLREIATAAQHPKIPFARAAFNYTLKQTGNSPKTFKKYIDDFIKHIGQFVKNNKQSTLNLKDNFKTLFQDPDIYYSFGHYYEKYNAEDEFPLIIESFSKIKQYNLSPETKSFSKEKKALMIENVDSILRTLIIFFKYLLHRSARPESNKIQQLLFQMIFNTVNSDPYRTTIYPVYEIMETFLFSTKASYLNLECSTGSGKTRCLPFFFAMRAIHENLERPFIIMTEPGMILVNDKYDDFQELFQNTVECIKNVKQMLKLYKKFHHQPKSIKKPILGIFSPFNLLKMMKLAEESNINIIPFTRFILDEIHERHVATDVVIATLSTEMRMKSFPFQLVMMSATPDKRILRCFSKVEKMKIEASTLFTIDEWKYEVNDYSDIQPQIIQSTCEILKNMESSEIPPGHILIFTSGNARMNQIQRAIKDQYQNCSGNNYSFCLIENVENMITSTDPDDFYEHLEERISTETNLYKTENPLDPKELLFLLPIKFYAYASNTQKEIAKRMIPNHPNVIKIITATNAIESSITIDGLAAVIDSGIRNQGELDKKFGYKRIFEEPISKKSQTQRKGRVGRVRNGISVQITMKKHPLINQPKTEMELTDLSTSILSLRGIGINLEEVEIFLILQ